MDKIKVIITGVTGMVGEGVLFECIQNELVSSVLVVGRKPYDISHPKVKELIIPDFLEIEAESERLQGYDACFFCAGISSVGISEERYRKITYDTTIHFAKVLAELNPSMVFNYVSGMYTDSTEKGRSMWARVKGKTENDLQTLGFRGQYNFRPGFMQGFKGQKNIGYLIRFFSLFVPTLFPKSSLTLEEVGRAMIAASTKGYPKTILEISDIKKSALQIS